MVSISSKVDELIQSGQQFIANLIDWGINFVSSQFSSFVQSIPLSRWGFAGIALVAGALFLAGYQEHKQNHIGRLQQPVALMGFAGAIIILRDFLPDKVWTALVAFVILGGIVAIVNVGNYVRGGSKSSEWYETVFLLFGSLTLFVILLTVLYLYVL